MIFQGVWQQGGRAPDALPPPRNAPTLKHLKHCKIDMFNASAWIPTSSLLCFQIGRIRNSLKKIGMQLRCHFEISLIVLCAVCNLDTQLEMAKMADILYNKEKNRV